VDAGRSEARRLADVLPTAVGSADPLLDSICSIAILSAVRVSWPLSRARAVCRSSLHKDTW